MNLGLDPVQCERHEPDAAFGIKSLDRFHQSYVAFLDQVGMRQAVTQIIACDRDHQAQVRHHQPTG